MAEAKKKPIAKGITPKGVLVFPYLNKPDTKFKAEGEFRAKLRLGGEDAEKLKAVFDKAHGEAVALIKSEEPAPAKRKLIKDADKPYAAELDKETGEETGFTLFTFKQKASIKNKAGEVFEKRPDLFDAARNPFPKDKLIYGGSTAKIAFEAWPFFTAKVGAGITVRLIAAQIIELRSNGPKDAAAHGFGDEGEGLPTDSTGEEPSGDGADAEDF